MYLQAPDSPGPIKVPDKNHPMAVARSVGLYISPIQDAPMLRKEVPSNAVRIRKTKYEVKLGDKAVPREQPRNKRAVMRQI
jgi:hypothetical protein